MVSQAASARRARGNTGIPRGGRDKPLSGLRSEKRPWSGLTTRPRTARVIATRGCSGRTVHCPGHPEREGAMRRILLFCCGLFLGLVAEVILWNSPVWYTNEESGIPSVLTQMAGVAVIV